MIEIKKEALTLKTVRQMFFRAHQKDDKVTFVEEYLKRNLEQERVIIFVNRRDFTVELRDCSVQRGTKFLYLWGETWILKKGTKQFENLTRGRFRY
jgi:superfamily II DNA/RNA helicase